MADEVDQTADRIENEISFTVGEHFARVVEVTDPRTGEVVESCGRCRDRRGIA